MRFDHDGMSLWYGTSDAPAPGETVHAGAAITIDVGVQPTDASNRVDVLYRVNDGAVQTVPAKWIRNNVSTNAQYHRVYLPPYRPGDKVDYIAVCHCAGRRVPSQQDIQRLTSSFRVVEAEAGRTSVASTGEARSVAGTNAEPTVAATDAAGDQSVPTPKDLPLQLPNAPGAGPNMALSPGPPEAAPLEETTLSLLPDAQKSVQPTTPLAAAETQKEDLQSSSLSEGVYGDSGAHPHDLLQKQGYSLPASEAAGKFFGPATREAVTEFQKQPGLQVSGAVDDYTEKAMNAAVKLPAADWQSTATKESLPITQGATGSVFDFPVGVPDAGSPRPDEGPARPATTCGVGIFQTQRFSALRASLSTLQVSIAPEPGVEVPPRLGAVFIDVVYTRAIGGETSTELADLPNTVQETVRATLDENLRATFALADVAPSSTEIVLCFLAANGSVRLRKTISPASESSNSFSTVSDIPLPVSLSAAEVAAIVAQDPRPNPPTPKIDRRAYFIPVGEQRAPFSDSTLQLAPVQVADGGWKRLGLDGLFHADLAITTAAPWNGALPSGLSAIPWTTFHLAVDGRFSFSFPKDAGDAWIWWLSGPLGAIGVVLDDLSVVRVTSLGVALPPFSGAVSSDAWPSRIPADVTEAEVASNPHIYTEDPGEFCKPFKNPERVLGERSFFVILRAEQPVISVQASVQQDPLPTFNTKNIATFNLAEAVYSSSRQAYIPPGPITGVVIDPVPGALVDNQAEVGFVRQTLPIAYLDALQRSNRGRSELDAASPIQWEGDVSRYQAATVARGHILELRMRWRSNGYSLGSVAKTLTLAPRQTKRIQKIEWRRSELARRQETTQLFDQVSDTLSRERDYDDSVQANLSEWARGASESSMSAGAGGFGFAAGGFVIGGGGGASNASSSSSQEGGRRTSASEEQRLRDSIRRHGDSLRKLDSMVVNEVTQEESVTGSTEVVRNANYGHSLTVIYYQILRHLKIETGVAGVRECLFVPFAITPFTAPRAYRWREFIQRGLRDPQYAGAIKYLKDVVTNFANSDVPPGRRSAQPVRYIFGSMYIKLAIERPRDKDDGSFDAATWTVVRPYLGSPALSIYNRLKALEEHQRDAIFQQQHAGVIAANWVDTLLMDASGTPLNADFTLATRYQFNGVVRVDFSVAAPSGVTRESLSSIRVRAAKDLPPGSVANLQSLSFTYQTDQFQRAVSASQGAGDLVEVESGVRDAGATIGTIPDAWERRDVRAEMIYAVQGLIEHLNEHVEYYTKVILWRMDRDRLFMLIDGFYVPSTNQISIASVVERDPIAIIGNAIVFRVSAGSFLGIGDIKTPAELFNHYVSLDSPSEPMLVSLPTDGLYAQTIMDECPALEEHFGNTDWVLNDPDPALGEIAPELLTSRRAEPQAIQPSPLPQTLINLMNAPEAPAPSGLAGALSAVTTPNAFRDMAGLAGTQANAAAAFQTAANLATNFGNQAAALKLAEIAEKAHAAQTADQKLATVQRAADKNLITGDDAQRHASQILDSLHAPASSVAPHETKAAGDLMDAVRSKLGDPLTSATLETTTPQGAFKVQLASAEMTPDGGSAGGVGSGSGGVGGEPARPPFPESFQHPIIWFEDAALRQAFRDAISKVSDDAHKSAYNANGVLPDASTIPIVIASLDPSGRPSFAGQNYYKMYYSGSLLKVAAMYAAFQLRKAVADFANTLQPGLTQVQVFNQFGRTFNDKIIASSPTIPGGSRVAPKYADILKVTPDGAHYKVEFLTMPDPSRRNFDGSLHRMIEQSHDPSAGVCIQNLGYSWINGVLLGAGMFTEDTSKSTTSLDRFEGIWLAGDYLYGIPYIDAQHRLFLQHQQNPSDTSIRWDADAEEEFQLGISGLTQVRIPCVNEKAWLAGGHPGDGRSAQATSCLGMANLFVQVANGTLIKDDVAANTAIGDMLKTAVAMSGIGRYAPSTHFNVLQSKIGVGTLGASGSCNPDIAGHTNGCVWSEAMVIQETAPPNRKYVVVYQDILDPRNHNSKDFERVRDIIEITIDKF